jgi:oligosaccharide repeat unit polymerase
MVITVKHVVCVALYLVLLSFPVLVHTLSASTPDQLVPHVYVFVLWILPILVLAGLRNTYNQLAAIIWIVWFPVGSANLIASYHLYGSFYLVDAEPVALVYLAFTFVFLVGMYLFENLVGPLFRGLRVRPRTTDQLSLGKLHPLFSLVLLVFPFVWFASVFLSLGFVPILGALRGQDINPELYTLSYGRLYGYALINVLSMLVAIEKLYTQRRHKWIYFGLLAILAFFVISTGKRHWVISFLLAAPVYLFRTKRITLRRLALAGCLVVGAYAGLQVVRQGINVAKYSSLASTFNLVGFEYRAYAYVVEHFEPGEIAGYDWAASTIASMANSRFLGLMGLDKDQLVYQGSAYSWRPIFATEFGIRSGIVSELYMAYGWAGLWIVCLFGVLTGWIGSRISRTRSRNALLFLSLIYATLLLSVVGQTTDTAGSLTMVLYTWIFYLVIKLLTPRRRAHPHVRRPEATKAIKR